MRESPPEDRRRLYGDLAWLWPIVSPPEDYIGEAEEIIKVIREHNRIEVKTLLDLGCGGGHCDYTLKNEFQVTGVDTSEAMLSLARKLNPEAGYFKQDMRAVRLGELFDCVLVADSVNCMLTEDDLRAVFETAFAHLKPGGVFWTFAEVTPESFEQNRTGCTFHTSGDIEITFIENLYDPEPSDTTYQVCMVYLVRRAGKLEVQTDSHLCGIFEL